MRLESLDLNYYALLFGGAVAVILGLGIGPRLNALTRKFKVTEDGSGWPDYPSGGRSIGILESLLFYLSLVVGYPVFIGAWLVFKVAAKWETWAHVVRLPELSESDMKSQQVEDRIRFGSWLLSRFLLGTLLNIAIAVFAAWLYFWVNGLLEDGESGGFSGLLDGAAAAA